MLSMYMQLGCFLQQGDFTNNNSQDLIMNILFLLEKEGFKLTAKELEILTYWIFGYSAKEIARVLILSPRTVECHMEDIKSHANIEMKLEIL